MAYSEQISMSDVEARLQALYSRALRLVTEHRQVVAEAVCPGLRANGQYVVWGDE